MTTREEIREGVLKIQICETDVDCPTDYKNFADPCAECRTRQTMEFLHSQGVVIKVDRELPKTVQTDASFRLGYASAQKDMVGYEVVESLQEGALPLGCDALAVEPLIE